MKRSVTVSIDSSKIHETSVSVFVDGATKTKHVISHTHTSQHVLPFIETILSENDLLLSDITDITFNTGPGSFTGLRVGAVVGNILRWLLNVPVNGRKVEKSPELDYGQDHWNANKAKL